MSGVCRVLFLIFFCNARRLYALLNYQNAVEHFIVIKEKGKRLSMPMKPQSPVFRNRNLYNARYVSPSGHCPCILQIL